MCLHSAGMNWVALMGCPGGVKLASAVTPRWPNCSSKLTRQVFSTSAISGAHSPVLSNRLGSMAPFFQWTFPSPILNCRGGVAAFAATTAPLIVIVAYAGKKMRTPWLSFTTLEIQQIVPARASPDIISNKGRKSSVLRWFICSRLTDLSLILSASGYVGSNRYPS
jgi:hypothetical protein